MHIREKNKDSVPMYSVIIPVYNSTNSLQELLERLQDVFNNQVRASFEIIMVDDASPNIETWPVIMSLADRYPEVRAYRMMRNFGKPGAVYCAFEKSRGQYIITMDDDLQHFPEDIPQLTREQSHDVVIGYFKNKKHSIFKKISSKIKNWFDYKLIGKPRELVNSPYKLIHRRIVEAVLKIHTTYPFISALIFYSTRDIVNVPIRHGQRKYGKTGYSIGKMYRQFSNLIINNSSILLKFIALLGIAMSAVSFGLALFYIGKKLFIGINTSGWTTIIVIILLTSGLILLSVGVIGEYLIRIINSVENKPSFLVRDAYSKVPDEQMQHAK